MSRLSIRTPPAFDFWRTVFSHGWAELPPFESSRRTRRLLRVFRLDGGRLVAATMHGSGGAVHVQTAGVPLTAAERTDLRRQVSTCLRLDEDFSGFHTQARVHPHYRWIASAGAGRLLRAPTLYEDVVKMICTTNCAWSLTQIMVEKLVARFGEETDGGRRAFPEAGAIANSSELQLRKSCSLGYRAPYVLDFSRRVASGRLDLESLRTSHASADELFTILRTIRGVGPYAAGNLLRLLGRYDHLALDSWVRGQYARLHTRGRPVKDRTIERRYAHLGAWRGLFFWLEMTRSWHDEKFRSSAGDRSL